MSEKSLSRNVPKLLYLQTRRLYRTLCAAAAVNLVAAPTLIAIGAQLDRAELSTASSLRLKPDRRTDPTNRLEASFAAAELGQRLFNDPRLSGKANISCASCHVPTQNFGEVRRLSVGPLGQVLRKTPSLRGVARFDWFFHDGRADTLWSQTLEVIENPREMDGKRESVALLLVSDASYRRLIRQLLRETPLPKGLQPPDPKLVTTLYVAAGKSLAAFLKHQDFLPSRFDRFADAVAKSDGKSVGDFSDTELRGYKLFVGRAKCVLCHRSPALSDGQFHNLGLPPNFAQGALDAGRYAAAKKLSTREFGATGQFSDNPAIGRVKIEGVIADDLMWGAFRTPSLRNSARSSSYMHDGRYTTLAEVVRFYSTLDGQESGHHREGVLTPLNLSESEIENLVAFLQTLDSGSIAKGSPGGRICGGYVPKSNVAVACKR